MTFANKGNDMPSSRHAHANVSLTRKSTMPLPHYSDGLPIEKDDAVLRASVVPARIIDVFDADPPALMPSIQAKPLLPRNSMI